jgi:hypothetical protein
MIPLFQFLTGDLPVAHCGGDADMTEVLLQEAQSIA